MRGALRGKGIDPDAAQDDDITEDDFYAALEYARAQGTA